MRSERGVRVKVKMYKSIMLCGKRKCEYRKERAQCWCKGFVARVSVEIGKWDLSGEV